MTPVETVYRIAKGQRDLRACHAAFGGDWVASWPTVVAERDGKVIGFLATNPSRKALIAGPLYAPNAIVGMRLIEAYEVVLRLGGVTRYLFNIKNLDGKWRRAVERAGFAPFAQDGEGRDWFERRLS